MLTIRQREWLSREKRHRLWLQGKIDDSWRKVCASATQHSNRRTP